ncbi:MAG: hypothetical protein IJ518_05920 [Clostridia bacterium]|nr:hypothetical protein [Clostridia bacterium]
MNRTVNLKQEFSQKPAGSTDAFWLYKASGYRRAAGQPEVIARAEAIHDLFALAKPHIYRNDLIVGSLYLLFTEAEFKEVEEAATLVNTYGERDFYTNFDHYVPGYRRFLTEGVPGTLARIRQSMETHVADAEKVTFLRAMHRTVEGFSRMIESHLALARSLQDDPSYRTEDIAFICTTLEEILQGAPTTFAGALQLIWLVHSAFQLENRYAMALGRIDQYLYPYYRKDIEQGTLTPERAQELLENVFMKIYERTVYRGSDDVVNIAIGGTAPDGSCEINELSYLVLRAVKECNVPGPNLSARITHHTPDAFLDECLQVIGTGLGYPALMNDEINLKALSRFGYSHEDICDYSMVGCIENFITGKQPAWTDGRFDPPKYFEYLLNSGQSMFGESTGIDTGSVESIGTMAELMARYSRQMAEGVRQYVDWFNERNQLHDPKRYVQPFMSVFCEDCIARGQDICDGGALYPSVHGVGLMGVGTVCDSLAAIERVVFEEKKATLTQIAEAMKANFVGYEQLRQLLLSAPKYGNDDDFADKYAVWFVRFLTGEFDRYRTPDGGYFYTAMAANINNIIAGRNIAATPDGRLEGTPLSDAASPTYGRDRLGPTATVNSLTKPDYSRVACGTVVNQKFSPMMFSDAQRARLLALIRVYFEKGGQEMQINATSREVLLAAMEHPEEYADLVVRVSGFSAYFVALHRSVQEDILARTQQG